MTNTELAILGLIAEKPKHGYQIEQDIEQRNMRQWSQIGFSSIYYVLNKLEKNGWLISKMQSEGSGPARRVYQLTQKGWQAYHDAVYKRLAQPRPRSADFDLALANLPALSSGEAYQAIEAYRLALIQRIERVQAKWQSDRQQALPPHGEFLFDYSLAMLQAHLDWVNRFLSQLETEKEALNGKN